MKSKSILSRKRKHDDLSIEAALTLASMSPIELSNQFSKMADRYTASQADAKTSNQGLFNQSHPYSKAIKKGFSDYIYLKNDSKETNQSFNKLLALDCDDCILESNTREQVIILFKTKLLALLNHAKNNHTKIIVITSREFAKEKNDTRNPFCIYEVLKELGLDFFHAIIFTNGVFKARDIKKMCDETFPSDDSQKYERAVFLDDSDKHKPGCDEAGIQFILVDKYDHQSRYLDQALTALIKPIVPKPQINTAALSSSK